MQVDRRGAKAGKVSSRGKGTRPRLDWKAVVAEAAAIVQSYETPVTLRQLFYRLVAAKILPNTESVYRKLSARTAEARRRGTFPELVDLTRVIHRPGSFESPEAARRWLRQVYRRDRTEGQPVAIFLGVEKRGLVAQLSSWFEDRSLPILSLQGYASQSYVEAVRADVAGQGRPAVLLYAGDHDSSGEDIDRDFVARTSCWSEVVRVALSWEQVVAFDLPPQPGKSDDARSAAFEARHGQLVQVELDALPPDVLRSLFEVEVSARWGESLFDASVRREQVDREAL